MLRILKTRHFSRWQRKTALSDTVLGAAVMEMRNGLIDADLGAGVVKDGSLQEIFYEHPTSR